MNTDLPPFYVGQKVVAVKDIRPSRVSNGWKSGDEFIVKGMMNCCKWKIDIGLPRLDKSWAGRCLNCKKWYDDKCVWLPSELFAPIHENFQSISLSKVLEEETKLISVN